MTVLPVPARLDATIIDRRAELVGADIGLRLILNP